MPTRMPTSGPRPGAATPQSRVLLLASLTALAALVSSACSLVAARPAVAAVALGLALLVTWRALDVLPREDLAGHDVRITHLALAVALASDLVGVIVLAMLCA